MLKARRSASAGDTLERDTLAELIGTFMLILIGAGSAALGAPLGLVALAYCAILIAIIATYGHISGAHVNPAITLALLVARKLPLKRAIYYWAAQFGGAISAMLVLRSFTSLLPPTDSPFIETIGVLTLTHPGQSAILETIFTFILVSVYIQTVTFSRPGAAYLASLGVGATFAACLLFGTPLTGASMNPARTVSLAMLYGNLSYVPISLAATFGGGALAGWVQCTIFKPRAAPANPIASSP